MSRWNPALMESAIINDATPAATPTMEITVITLITACRRLARRYRAATKNSNFTAASHKSWRLFGRDAREETQNQRYGLLVVVKFLSEAFREFALFQPDHQGKVMKGDGKPEQRNAAIKNTHQPGDEQQVGLHQLRL